MSIIDVQIGDKKYKARRVNLASMEKHEAFFKRAFKAHAAGAAEIDENSLNDFREMAEIIHECIVRVQPEVTLEEIKDGLDIGSAGLVYGGVMSGSGFVPAGEGMPATSPTLAS
jgi:hypothetical protein